MTQTMTRLIQLSIPGTEIHFSKVRPSAAAEMTGGERPPNHNTDKREDCLQTIVCLWVLGLKRFVLNIHEGP